VPIKTKDRNSFLKLCLVLARLTLISLVVTMALSSTKPVEGHQGDGTMKEKSIEEVLKEHADELMSIPGVVGAAQGLCNNKPCIKVFVIEKTKEIEQKIPDELDGYPVGVEQSGEFRSLP
jgi:hypothetical protein